MFNWLVPLEVISVFIFIPRGTSCLLNGLFLLVCILIMYLYFGVQAISPSSHLACSFSIYILSCLSLKGTSYLSGLFP